MIQRCVGAVLLMSVVALQTTHAQRGVASRDEPRRQTSELAPSEALLARPVTVHLSRVSLRQAVDLIATKAGVPIQYQSEAIAEYVKPVTLDVTATSLGTVLDRILVGTGLHPVADGPTRIMLVPTDAREAVGGPGDISGTVIDADTHEPVAGAMVTLDDAARGRQTGQDGTFRLDGVSSGAHRVTVRLLGYGRQAKAVTVTEGQVTSVRVVLSRSANTLDQVVVTGTVIPTERKAVPNAMTVITAKEIEERGITKIDQLFRGDVPGVFAQNSGSGALLDQVTMFSRGASALSFQSRGVDENTGTTNPIKTYVDGVELADPKYLSQIDPKSIERIEILTGPQASTIYGSNAINGVMQIFTKRGTTSAPQLTLNLQSGWVQNNFSPARTPQHDYSAQLSGLGGNLSYNAGGSWNYVGPWTPAKQLTRLGAFGGARIDLPTFAGKIAADVTLRRSTTRSLQRGIPQQTMTDYQQTGWYQPVGGMGLIQPTLRSVLGQTLGMTMSYAPTSWWSHELSMGADASDQETRSTLRSYASISDTTLFVQQIHEDRRSMRYATTASVPVSSFSVITATAGVDAWQNLTSSWYVQAQTLTGPLAGFTDVSRQPDHNTGGFLQTQLALRDRLFLTYGLRAEWNPNYGAEAQPNYAPRFGAAYTQDVGLMTVKLRGAYGRSTRPPLAALKTAKTVADVFGSAWSALSAYILPYYGGIFNTRLANPDLAPEHQQGGEGGLELYLGSRASLIVTRYNQTVDGLIAEPYVDSAHTLVPCHAYSPPCIAYGTDAAGHGYFPQTQDLNIGSIRNQGWELQGSVNSGPFTTHGTYSWTKSRTIGVNPRYRSFFAGQPQYTPGASFEYLPEHTWALGVTYVQAQTTVALTVMGTGQVTYRGNAFSFRNLSSDVRLQANQYNVSHVIGYAGSNPAYALADVTASHRFASEVEGLLQVQNLANRYTNDSFGAYATMGRQVKLGARIRTQ